MHHTSNPRFYKILLLSFILLLSLALACTLLQVVAPAIRDSQELPDAPPATAALPCPLITLAPSESPLSIFTLEPTPATPPAELVVGAVAVAGGRSAMGGYAGDSIQIPVDYTASSPLGKVTQMRGGLVGSCSTDLISIESFPWETFTGQKTFTMILPINWVGFYTAVQYRDNQGNVSPVYCDDISVEGNVRPPVVLPEGFAGDLRCLAETEVRPGAGEHITCGAVLFHWRPVADLPEGLYYQVSVYQNQPGGTLVAQGQTLETELALPIDPAYAGELVWYVVFVDGNGTMVDHSSCSSFPASLIAVDPPEGIKGVRFWYEP
jgi:hypothetical protein